MKCLVGKVRRFQATIGVSAPSTCGTKTMVCLENVTIGDDLFREHCWVERKEGMGKKGTKIAFRSRVRQYLSLNEKHEQVTKIGLSKIKIIMEK